MNEHTIRFGLGQGRLAIGLHGLIWAELGFRAEGLLGVCDIGKYAASWGRVSSPVGFGISLRGPRRFYYKVQIPNQAMGKI